MYVKSDLKRGNLLLKVNDDFAILNNILPREGESRFIAGELQFNFNFTISQIEALKQNALTVLITVKSEHQIVPRIVEKSAGKNISSKGRDRLVQNILTHKTKLKNIINNNQNIILQKYADITSKVDKQLLSSIKNDKPIITTETGLIKRKIIARRKLIDQNIGKISTPINSELSHYNLGDFDRQDFIDKESQKTRIKLLKSGISPSVITNLTKRSISSHEKLSGTVRKITYPEYNQDIVALTNACYTKGIESIKQESAYETVIDQNFDEFVVVSIPVSFDSSVSQGSLLIVEFSLLQTIKNFDRTKQVNVLEKVEKKLDIQSHINDFYRFSKPFNVISSITKNQIFFEIEQHEKLKRVGSNKVNVYKKVIDDNMSETYRLIQSRLFNSFFSESEIIKKFVVNNFYNESSIYRFVPVDFNNEMSCEFTDVVITPPRKVTSNKVIVIPSLSKGQINIDFFNTDFLDIVAVRLLMRNLTTKEKEYSLATLNSIKTFNQNKNYGFFNSTVITNLIPHHTYEFTTKLIFRDGTERLSSYSAIIENVPFTADIDTPEIIPTTTEDDITFELNSIIPEDQVGLLKRLLLSVSSTYSQESLNSRNAPLDKFLAFNIIRYDLTNGDVSNLGIIGNNETFSDAIQSKKFAIQKSQPGKSYRYVIYPLLRDPKSITETNVSVRDQETRKEYNFNPRKHYHPIATLKGTSVSRRFIEADTKNDMLYGTIGTSTSIDVTIPFRNNIQVTNCNVGFVNRKKIVLTWSVNNDIRNIDHFIILKEVNDVRTIVGKSHCLESRLTFFYDLTQNDIGNFRFLLIPIDKNYLSSVPFSSNYLLINLIS